MKFLRQEGEKYIMEKVSTEEIEMTLEEYTAYKTDREEKLVNKTNQEKEVLAEKTELEEDIATFI